MKIKVGMCCSSTSGGSDDRVFHLAVRDESSGVEFLDVNMTCEEFSMMLTAHHTGGIEADVRGLDRIGMALETKEVQVPFDFYKAGIGVERESHIMAALAPFEVDGWTARKSDMTNHHRTTGKGFQRVAFSRNVPKESK
jgi:hypothetical protein